MKLNLITLKKFPSEIPVSGSRNHAEAFNFSLSVNSDIGSSKREHAKQAVVGTILEQVL